MLAKQVVSELFTAAVKFVLARYDQLTEHISYYLVRLGLELRLVTAFKRTLKAVSKPFF